MKKLLLCIVTVAAFASMNGVALGGRTYSAEAFIQNGNGDCGANLPQDAAIGVVTFHRTGNVVRVAVDLAHGTPDVKYGVVLFENSPAACDAIDEVAAFPTNNRGEGSSVGQTLVPEEATRFFAWVYGGSREGDTPTVTLP
jgi:hypothetical protein